MSVKFYRGLAANYNATTHANGIFFCTDTQEIMMNGKAYGLSTTDLALLNDLYIDAITSATYDAGTITFVNSDNNECATISIPMASTTEDGLMSSTDYDLLQDTAAAVETLSSGAAASIVYDSTAKTIKLMAADKTTVLSTIDATDFIKDGMLSNATLSVDPEGKPAGTYIVLDFNTDAESDPIYINVTSLIDEYTAGQGIDISANEVAIKLANTEKYLEFDTSNNLVTTGIDAAINAAKAAATTTIDEKTTGHVTVTKTINATDGHAEYTIDEDDIASAADLTQLRDDVESYVVNGYAIKDNPELNGDDIYLTGYTAATEGADSITANDTVNTAIASIVYDLTWHEA